ncbi:MAG: YfhO family protein [Clostridiales bacterium]|nr:YfhO family protein [Clostridiales bacterium]
MKELDSLGQGKKASAARTKAKEPKLALREKRKPDYRPLLAFVLALALYAFTAIICNKYPTGEYSFILSDLKAQYAPFLALNRARILSLSGGSEHLLNNLTYSFQLGLGKNVMGTFGYYMASPLNLIYLLFEPSQVDLVVILLVILKLSFASGFMALFLGTRTEDKKTKWPVLLGIVYAFSLYAQAFAFQIMWLDGYMLLPLLLYFVEKFITRKRYLGIIVTLLLLFVSNYYIAYMVGIYSFLYLIVRMITLKTDLKKAVGTVVRYVLTAGFTGMCTAVLILPVGIDTIVNSDKTKASSDPDLIMYSPLTFIKMFLMGDPGEFMDVLPANYPFFFLSLAVTILVVIYVTSKVFSGREKTVHLFCLVGAFLSTGFYYFDKAWQVFDDPNWFYHRHAFVFLTIFLVITLRVLERVKEIPFKDVRLVAVIVCAGLVITYAFGRFKDEDKLFIYNLLFILAYCALIAGYGVKDWHEQLKDVPQILSPILAVFIGFELVFAGPMLSSGIESFTMFSGNAREYISAIDALEEYGVRASIQNSELGAARAETEHVSGYYPTYYVEEGEQIYGNFRNMSFFNSNSNKRMHHFLKQLGYPVNYNYFAASYDQVIPSNDAFLSIGSVASRRPISFYEKTGTDSFKSGLDFYKAGKTMPIAFAAAGSAADFDFYKLEKTADEKNYFAFQNEWYASMFPGAFTSDFFITMNGREVSGPEITNGISYNKNAYRSRAEVMKDQESSEAGKASESKSASENDDSAPVQYDDPIGFEGVAAKELNAKLKTIYRQNEKLPIRIEYHIKAPSTSEIYCNLSTARILNETDVYVNGIRINSFESGTFYSQVFRIGSFEQGEDVTVTFLSEAADWSYLDIRFGYFDYKTFERQIGYVDLSKVKTEALEDGYAKFTVNGVSANEMVITTIPAEDGWKLTIDGQEAELGKYQDAFLSFKCPEGTHTVELSFTPPGLKIGAMASCAGIVCLAAFVFIDKKVLNNRKEIKTTEVKPEENTED